MIPHFFKERIRNLHTIVSALRAGTLVPDEILIWNNDPSPVEGMAQSKGSFDYTHLGAHGADYFAKMMAESLARAVPGMRPLLIP